MSNKEKIEYPGSEVKVEWDGRLCIHIAECVHAKGELFVGGRDPWCQPDLVDLEEVIGVVGRCPTGALSYQAKSQDNSEKSAPENTVTVSYNGPLFARGELQIENAPEDMHSINYRAALCRCGHSKNKPFCDGNHEHVEFRDYGAVGEMGEGLSATGGKLAINPLEDGPLICSGNLTIRSSSGRVAWEGKQVALCRCGASENKPFCDGSHAVIEFKSA